MSYSDCAAPRATPLGIHHIDMLGGTPERPEPEIFGQAAGGGAGAADATWLGLARRLKRLLEYYAQDGRSGRLRAARQAVLPLLDPALHLAVAGHFGQGGRALHAPLASKGRARAAK
eukprot:COSAG04_NODE_1864_length_5351_cov_145.728517_4_plen_117_part_00